MQLAITFRNFDASESLKDHTRERLERLTRNVDRACTAHVVLTLERHLHHADVTVVTGPLVLRAKHATADMYASVDCAVDCLEEQLRREKDRNKHHHGRAWVHHQQDAWRGDGFGPLAAAASDADVEDAASGG